MVSYYVKIKSYPSSLSDEGLSIDWIEDFYEIKNANLLKVVKVIKLTISLKMSIDIKFWIRNLL